MAYTFFRGADLLGGIETVHESDKFVSGVLIPRDDNVTLGSEGQMHFPALDGAPANIARLLQEPELLDGPPRAGQSGGALNPVTDDMLVAPKDELRVLEDDVPVPARDVSLQEKRYVDEIPPGEMQRVPAAAWRGRSYWEVTIFIDEIAPADLAMLEDRVRVDNGQPQRYGSQLDNA